VLISYVLTYDENWTIVEHAFAQIQSEDVNLCYHRALDELENGTNDFAKAEALYTLNNIDRNAAKEWVEKISGDKRQLVATAASEVLSLESDARHIPLPVPEDILHYGNLLKEGVYGKLETAQLNAFKTLIKDGDEEAQLIIASIMTRSRSELVAIEGLSLLRNMNKSLAKLVAQFLSESYLPKVVDAAEKLLRER